MRVGIDLGTTYCAIAYIDPKTGKAKVIQNSEGKSITPSVLYFDPNGSVLHGEEAKAYVEEGSDRTANYFKYYMGDETYAICQNGRDYTAVDLSAELLKGIVKEAEQETGEYIGEAVITVPAYFNHLQRQATMRAGQNAGLTVLNIISEPTAAVFAYGIHGSGINQTVLVYDLGGGTFDVTIARITDDRIDVLGTDGDHRLGGKNWDDALSNYLADCFYDEFGIDVGKDTESNIMLQAISENTKKQLTEKKSAKAVIYCKGCRGAYEITDEIFAEITSYNLNRTKDIIQKLFDELQIGWEQIDGVLLVGGSTRMKQVKTYLTDMCGKPPMNGVNVDEAVALGAAIRANIDRNGLAAPVESGSLFSIGGSVSKPQFSIAGAKKISDATAHSMGMIAVSQDGERFVNSIMIKKNSKIPSEVTKSYELGVSKKQENRLEVYMLQGEEETLVWPLNCTVLGKYVFTGIQAGGQRKETIDVTFYYDENNIVNVTARQKRTGSLLDLKIEQAEDDMDWVVGNPKNREGTSMPPELAVLLAVDLSGSMEGEGITEARKAAVSFVRQFDMEYTKIGIINFANQSILYQPLTDDRNRLIVKIQDWEINGDNIGYGTSAEPFTLAYEVLNSYETDMKYVIVLTDGFWKFQDLAIAAAKKCHKNNMEVIALGFADANTEFLDAIASRKDFSAFTDLSELETTLTGIAKMM